MAGAILAANARKSLSFAFFEVSPGRYSVSIGDGTLKVISVVEIKAGQVASMDLAH